MRWFLFITFYILVDIYAFQAVETLTKSPWIYGFYVFISLAVLAGLIYRMKLVFRQNYFLVKSRKMNKE